MKLILNLNKHRWLLESSLIKKATHWTTGTLNRTEDGMYCFYLDYDLMEEDYVKGELKHLQEIYDLGNIHVFQSSKKSFHAISFVKLKAKEFVEIMQNSSCDESFKNVPRYASYRNWVLRHFSKGEKDKPQYLYTLNALTNKELSSAHFDLISKIYPSIKINEKMNSNWDGLKEMEMISYPTAKV